jgi:hypothetical protein
MKVGDLTPIMVDYLSPIGLLLQIWSCSCWKVKEG